MKGDSTTDFLALRGLQEITRLKFGFERVEIRHDLDIVRRRHIFTAMPSKGEPMKGIVKDLDYQVDPCQAVKNMQWIRKTSKRTKAGMAANLAALGVRCS